MDLPLKQKFVFFIYYYNIELCNTIKDRYQNTAKYIILLLSPFMLVSTAIKWLFEMIIARPIVKKQLTEDESGISDIYRYYNIPIYTKTIFANISPLTWSFYIRYKPQEEDHKNKHQVFTWNRGELERLYIENGIIMQEEYMYIHFLRRKMDYQFTDGDCAVIYPNRVVTLDKEVTLDFIMKHSKNNMVLYYIDLIKRKRNKINSDDELYLQMMREPAFIEGFSLEEKEKEFENFLFHIIDQDYNKAFRRNRSDFGRKYEKKARITNKYYNYLLQINSLVHRIKRR